MTSTMHDFLKVKGEYSMRNLTVMISMVVGSVIVLGLMHVGKLTAEIFGLYMLAGGGVYGVGKWQDDKTTRAEIEVDKPPPVSPDGPTTLIQMGAGQPGKVKDMNVEAEGDVVVASKPKRKRK